MTPPISESSTLPNILSHLPSTEPNNQDTSNEVQKQSHSSPEPPASTRFFGISELLEMTLLQVPPLRLLVIQRVNKQFLDTISTSKSLQQKLFFKADHRTSTRDGYNVEWNPFLRELEDEWELWELHHLSRRPHDSYMKIRMRDFANVHPNASWGKMFVTQPPLHHVAMTRYHLSCSSQVVALAVVAAENGSEGCRMGDLCEYEWKENALSDDYCYVRVQF